MKHIIILGDGMADETIPSIGNKTILQAAKKPHIDQLALKGRCGMLDTIPQGYAPGSEIANLSVLGYDIPKIFEGRGSLEAASIGIEIAPNEMVMRCNLICIDDGKIKNHSAGHISTEEANELILFLEENLGNDIFQFHTGVSYRHILKIKGGEKHLKCTPPHDALGVATDTIAIQATCEQSKHTAEILNELTRKSQRLLENHPINIKRQEEGKDKANSIWLWSPGYKPTMEKMTEKYPINSGSVISAVDLIKGIGVYAGLNVIQVDGATGLHDTNYEGKAQAAIQALKNEDFVYLHIEASDEAGHEGNVPLKIKTVEYLDQRIVAPIITALQTWDTPFKIAILPDHPTPCATRTHTNKPVPFLIYCSEEMEGDKVTKYDEDSCQQGSYGLLKGEEFIQLFFQNSNPKFCKQSE